MGYDRRGEDNAHMVVQLLRSLSPDIAALQETGLMRLLLGNRYYIDPIARAAGMQVIGGPPAPLDTWGCAILSRLPVVSWGWRKLPSRIGENACEVHAELDLGSGLGVLKVVNVHLGNSNTPDNDQQVAALLTLLDDLDGINSAGIQQDNEMASVHGTAGHEYSYAHWQGLRRAGMRERGGEVTTSNLLKGGGNGSEGRCTGCGNDSYSSKNGIEGQMEKGDIEDNMMKTDFHRFAPLVLTGDFNFIYGSPGYQRTVKEGGMTDAADTVPDAPISQTATITLLKTSLPLTAGGNNRTHINWDCQLHNTSCDTTAPTIY
ncbi:unnamed protein product, partial [Choristocarpus tenellus]